MKQPITLVGLYSLGTGSRVEPVHLESYLARAFETGAKFRLHIGESGALAWAGPHVREWTSDSGAHWIFDSLISGVDEKDGLLLSTEPSCVARRDPTGLKSAYWSHVGQFVIVSNRIEAVLALMPAQARPDLVSASAYLNLQALGNRTYVEGIAQIPPGHRLCLTSGLPMAVPCWAAPSLDLRLADPHRASGALRETIQATMGRVLSRRGNVGLEISGGLDSSSLMGLAKHIRRRRGGVLGVSAAYSDPGADEGSFVDAVERHLQIPIYRFDGMAVDDRNLTRPILERPGGRLVSNFGIAELELMSHLGLNTLVLGFGGDQLFWDHEAFAVNFLTGTRGCGLKELKASRLKQREHRATVIARAIRWKAKGMLRRAGSTGLEHFRRQTTLARCIKGTLPDTILALTRSWQDENVQAVFPFLDRTVVELVLSVPSRGLSPSPLSRTLLRRAMGPFLPEVVRTRAGKGQFSDAVIGYRAAIDQSIRAAMARKTTLSNFLAQEASAWSPEPKTLSVRWKRAWHEAAAAHLNAWCGELDLVAQAPGLPQ